MLLLDTFGSMRGNAVTALNEGLRAFQEDLIKDPLASRRVEVATAAPIPTRPRNVRARVAVVFALVMLLPSVASPIGKSPSGVSPQGSVQAPAKKPPAPTTTSLGQIQGRDGSWNDVNTGTFRCAFRFFSAPAGRYHNSGFRCARSFSNPLLLYFFTLCGVQGRSPCSRHFFASFLGQGPLSLVLGRSTGFQGSWERASWSLVCYH